MKTVLDPEVARKVSKILLQIKAVTINTKKPYRFTSGILSPMYTDNRLLISNPAEWKKIIGYYIQALRNHIGLNKIAVLSGTATAAIPHAAVLAAKLKLPMIYVRSAKKEHGKENLIEGAFKKGSRVLIIEDLISTGKSSMQNIEAVRKTGGKVNYCIAITTSTTTAFIKSFTQKKVKLITLTNALITVQTAVDEGFITKKQQHMVEEFFNDSLNWGRKMGFEK